MAFQDWELPSVRRGMKLEKNECSLIFVDGKYYSLTFNQTISKDIQNQGFTHINIKQDDITGEVGIEINKEKGLKLSTTGNKSGSFNYKMDSRSWVARLHDALSLEKNGNRYIIKLSDNLSRLDRCLFFRIVR